MINPTHYENKTVVILGLGRSGRSVAKAMQGVNAHVLAWDDEESARIRAVQDGIPLADFETLDWSQIDSLVLSPGIPHHYPAPHPIVARAQMAGVYPISDIEVLCLSQPQAVYVGITGTNGKSTTTSLIGHVLKEQGKPCEVGGNLGIPVLDLNPLSEEGVYVLELSSYQLELTPHFHPQVAVLLNITPDHLDRHGGMEGYVAAKKMIFRHMGPQDVCVISVDDPYCLGIYEAIEEENRVNMVPISTCKLLSQGVSVKEGILYEDGIPLCSLHSFERLRGVHNWQNIAAAFATLRALGLSVQSILENISSFPGLAHRQQVVGQKKQVTFVNDSKATNTEAVIKALLCYQENPLYILLGGRAKEGGISDLQSYFSFLKGAFLYGEAAQVFSLTLEGHVPYVLCATLEEATQAAYERACQEGFQNAVVLLSPACASFDQYRDFESRGEAFCAIAKKIIEEEAP